MHRVGFIIAILAIPALAVLVRGLLGLWRVTLRCIWLLLWRILLVLLWLLWLIWRLSGGRACMREHGMTGMAVLAVDCVTCVAGGAVGDKGIPAVCAHPLSSQVLCAAFRAGNC